MSFMFPKHYCTSVIRCNILYRQKLRLANSVSVCQQRLYANCPARLPLTYLLYPTSDKIFPDILSLNPKRCFSRKKKLSKTVSEETEESDDEDEEDEDNIEQDDMSDNILTKNVPSLRLDTVLKFAFNTTKKKIEKEFYSSNLRINGQKVVKKATPVHVGDELDLVKGVSPDNSDYLLVDRVTLKSVGKPTGNGNYPLKMEVLRNLTIENYSDPWFKSSPTES